MRIQINPHSLLNLEQICEVLHKLHPSVLHKLVELERSFGSILGLIDLDNLSMDERNFLANFNEVDLSENKVNEESMDEDDLSEYNVNKDDLSEYIVNKDDLSENNVNKDDLSEYIFFNLKKYLKLDTDEYIPMKIYVEVEDPILGRKVKELVEALEKTRAPEQFYFCKREEDEYAYFAEGYGVTMNEEQRKQRDDFFYGEDVKSLKKLLRKKSLI